MTPLVSNGPPNSYWPALDGLRGLAILMVFGFHLPFGPFRAGSYGVILFFVLSGFLITTILLREVDQKGAVDLRRFYERRLRRLLPALLVVVMAHLVIQITILGEPERWWERSWPVLAYVANYAEISGSSLFHMAHTWSLAVEEHFYLLWPVAFLALPRRWRFATTCALCGLFMVWRVTTLITGASHDRVYFGTDTNAFAPLLGCALAVAVYENRLSPYPKRVAALSVAGLIAVACIPWQYVDRRLLYGAIPVAVLSAAAIHSALFEPPAFLQNPFLRWFGKISYGLYLWHYMMISLPWERLLPLPPFVPMIVTPVALAWLSWRFVEAPLLGRPERGTSTGRDESDPSSSLSEDTPPMLIGS